MDNRRTLYIGAHADDVVINACITINRYSKSAYILTMTDGVPFGIYPKELGGITLDNHDEYVRQRLNEDKSAMQMLGLNVGERYTNGEIPDGQSYKNPEKIVSIIETLVKREKIGRIMTHSFPGGRHPAHPDHEIVSVCSYIVGKQYGIEVWEYPRFKSDVTGKQADRIFFEEEKIETVRHDFTSEEISLRDKIMRIFITQGFIIEKYNATFEVFGRGERDPGNIPDTTDFYCGADYRPGPQELKKAINDFFITGYRN